MLLEGLSPPCFDDRFIDVENSYLPGEQLLTWRTVIDLVRRHM